MLALFDAIPRDRVNADTGTVLNSKLPDDHYLYANQNITYEYQLSAQILEQINAEIDAILKRHYLGTELPQPLPDWFMYTAIDDTYSLGTANALANLEAITDQAMPDLITTITQPAYINRVALIRARVFENMKGLTDSMRADISDTMARGMQSGLGPREIAKNLRGRVGVSLSRANRIARTEINVAHRRAGWEQDRDARQRLGIRTGLMHISALLPTTRKTHADRMGNVYTEQEVEEWYSKDANSIQCRCAQISVLLDENGQPTDKKLQERLQERGNKFFAANPDN